MVLGHTNNYIVIIITECGK